jgi:hypothetical protein
MGDKPKRAEKRWTRWMLTQACKEAHASSELKVKGIFRPSLTSCYHSKFDDYFPTENLLNYYSF